MKIIVSIWMLLNPHPEKNDEWLVEAIVSKTRWRGTGILHSVWKKDCRTVVEKVGKWLDIWVYWIGREERRKGGGDERGRALARRLRGWRSKVAKLGVMACWKGAAWAQESDGWWCTVQYIEYSSVFICCSIVVDWSYGLWYHIIHGR